MNRKRKYRRHARRPAVRRRAAGVTLIELIAMLVLLGTVLAVVVPLLAATRTQRRAAENRFVASQETANILERFAARDWKEITQKSADTLRLSDEASRSLKEARLSVRVVRLPQSPPAKRITVELRWKDHAGNVVFPARLTGFVYKTGEQPR